MNNNVIKMLGAVCGVLAVILIAEWWWLKSADKDVQQSLNADLGSTPGDTSLPTLEQSKKSVESYADMIERPLFITGRRPVEIEAQDEVVQEVAKIDHIQLFGVYSVKDEKTALFDVKGSADKTYEKRKEGEDVSGWSLEEILYDRVVLQQSGNKQTLMLRKPKPKQLKPSVRKTNQAAKRRQDMKKKARKTAALPVPDPEVDMPEDL